MQIAHLLTRACTVTNRTDSGAVDDYGNPVPAETEVDTTCELQQQRRSEPVGEGELSDTLWLLVLPAGTTIDTGDKVTVDGQEFEMVGDPWPVREPRTGQESHLEASVRRVA